MRINNNQNIIKLPNEIFKEIMGYTGLYAVSDHGRIYSFRSDKLLKPTINSGGYYKVGLCTLGKQKTFKVHKLVADAFLIKQNDNYVVDHINRNKLDNNVLNLRFVSISDNNKNREVKGTIFIGTNMLKSGLTSIRYYIRYTPLNQTRIQKSFKDRTQAESFLSQLQVIHAR